MDAEMLVTGALIALGLVIVVAALIERPPLAMQSWDDRPRELDEAVRSREPWGAYVVLLVFLAVVIFVALFFLRAEHRSIFSDLTSGVSNALGP